jgi:iron-sulfur cluster repair protein YtfE (RIC family)
MIPVLNQTISEIVAQDPGTASIFGRFGIDPGRQGHLPVLAAAEQGQADSAQLVAHLVIARRSR